MKMESWLLYALLAMFSFGLYNVLLKISVDKKLGGDMNPVMAVLVASIAIFASALIYGAYTRTISLPSKTGLLVLMLVAGVLWMVGTVASGIALQRGNASQAVPIYNANTLIAVLISLFFLGELATVNLPKVAIGIVLIMVGAFFLA